MNSPVDLNAWIIITWERFADRGGKLPAAGGGEESRNLKLVQYFMLFFFPLDTQIYRHTTQHSLGSEAGACDYDGSPFRRIEPQHVVTFALVTQRVSDVNYINVQVRQVSEGPNQAFLCVFHLFLRLLPARRRHVVQTARPCPLIALFFIRVLVFFFSSCLHGRRIDIQSHRLSFQLFTRWLCCGLKYAKEHLSNTWKKVKHQCYGCNSCLLDFMSHCTRKGVFGFWRWLQLLFRLNDQYQSCLLHVWIRW